VRDLLRAEARQVRPFFWLLTAWMAGVGVWTLRTTPALAGASAVTFGLLMALQTGLHWTTPLLVGDRRRAALYLAAQSVLAATLTLLSRSAILAFMLPLALLGETAGMLRGDRLMAPVALGCLSLSAVLHGVLSGFAGLAVWAVAALPMAVFVTVYVVLYLRQAEARAQAQALLSELGEANSRLSEYAAQVQELTLAAERQRMARELHDTLAQGLAGLILQLEAASSHLERGGGERAQTILAQAMARARETLGAARQAIDDLRAAPPPAPLAASLATEAERFTQATGIPCDAVLPDLPQASEEVEACVRQVVAEALANVARHARAARASVSLARGGDSLEVTVSDDGVGFDPSAVPPGHYGLLGIRERVRLLEGEVVLETAPGEGCCLMVRLPLALDEEAPDGRQGGVTAP
jgi:NarL family two-component system sensor histidine kinase YdfH